MTWITCRFPIYSATNAEEMMNILTLADYYRVAGVFAPAMAEDIGINPNKIPVAHQISGLKALTQWDRFNLLDDPGTGKTLIAQAYALWLVGQQNRGVCVMPPVLLEQFLASFSSTYPGYEKHVRCEIMPSDNAKRLKVLANWDAGGWPDIAVMSHKMFLQYYLELMDKGFNFGIFDEATLIGLKTSTSKMHRAVKIFGGYHRRDSNGIVLMTGTPVETHPIDAYGLIAIVTPDQYKSLHTFEHVHCVQIEELYMDAKGKERVRVKTVGYKNLEVLHHSLLKQGRRVKKADVSKDLPPRIITEIPVYLHPAHQTLYMRMVDERILEVGDRVLDFTDSSRLYQGMQRCLLTPEKFTTKPVDNAIIETVQTLVDALEGRKVIVYAWYKDSIAALRRHFQALNPAVLNSTTSSHRNAEKMKFIEDPTCRMVIANPRSGGVGIDGWQDVCSDIIFAEVCPFIGAFQQAISRLHRTGQKAESVNIAVIVALATIAVKLRNDLIRGDREQEAVIQDRRKILSDLRGDRGLIGSLDNFDFDAEVQDEIELVDIDQE